MMDEATCPACGSRAHYRLKDHRLQCAECRKKYTGRARRCRLSDQTLQLLVRSFWRMLPASESAAELGLNVKTLHKYHDRLRRAISDAGEKSALRQLGSVDADSQLFYRLAQASRLAAGVRPLFCLARNGGQSLLLVAREAGGGAVDLVVPGTAGWIYARDLQAQASLDLDRIHFLPAGRGDERNGRSGFWISAKRGLTRYGGGFRKNFHLFMREMEFRFNNDDEDFTCGVLLDYLQKNPTNRDGR